MTILSAELANESSQLHIRNAAALALKNALSARVRKRVVSLFPSNDTALLSRMPRDNQRPQTSG